MRELKLLKKATRFRSKNESVAKSLWTNVRKDKMPIVDTRASGEIELFSERGAGVDGDSNYRARSQIDNHNLDIASAVGVTPVGMFNSQTNFAARHDTAARMRPKESLVRGNSIELSGEKASGTDFSGRKDE